MKCKNITYKLKLKQARKFEMPPSSTSVNDMKINSDKLVEEVTTTFGTGGYRQKITIPHKIKGTNSIYSSRK